MDDVDKSADMLMYVLEETDDDNLPAMFQVFMESLEN
jgi:hypothetical protein